MSKILVVDNDASRRTVIRDALTGLGCPTECVMEEQADGTVLKRYNLEVYDDNSLEQLKNSLRKPSKPEWPPTPKRNWKRKKRR